MLNGAGLAIGVDDLLDEHQQHLPELISAHRGHLLPRLLQHLVQLGAVASRLSLGAGAGIATRVAVGGCRLCRLRCRVVAGVSLVVRFVVCLCLCCGSWTSSRKV